MMRKELKTNCVHMKNRNFMTLSIPKVGVIGLGYVGLNSPYSLQKKATKLQESTLTQTKLLCCNKPQAIFPILKIGNLLKRWLQTS